MKLRGDLESFLENASRSGRGRGKFPRQGVNYFAQYRSIRDRMNETIHRDVTSMAASHDGGMLTDHGEKHIEKVIERCSILIDGSALEITPYEAYLLLIAIHYHDIGNARGRKGHEKSAATIVREQGLETLDNPETMRILQIARAHGGTTGGNRDTIGALSVEEGLLGQTVHPQKLAALLRIGDELADDATRASRLYIKDDSYERKISDVYHAYALALQSVDIDHPGQQVRLSFAIEVSQLLRKFRKDNRYTYLMSEILRRTYKVYTELLYVSQFLLPEIILRRVSVMVEVYSGAKYSEVDKFGYRISTDGWAIGPSNALYSLSPELQLFDGGGRLTPRSVFKKFSKHGGRSGER